MHRSPDGTRVASGLLMLLVLLGCEREQRRFDTPPSAASGAGPAQQSALHPGPSASAASAAYALVTPAGPNPHEQNAFAVATGKRLYRWYNCGGCHANGG